MDCDYYIKQLEVTHIDDNDIEYISFIELDTKSSQDSDYNYNSRKYGNVTYQPRVLFNNGKWESKRIQEKYENLITKKIGNDMLLNIIKQEVRYFL